MTAHFLDTSAWAKMYMRERGSVWMTRWHAGRPSIAVSSLGIVEMLAVLGRKRASEGMTNTQFRSVSHDVLSDASRYTVLSLDGDVFAAALRLPASVPLRAGDTVQLASLLHLRDLVSEEGEDVALVSADGALNDAALAQEIRVLDPALEEG